MNSSPLKKLLQDNPLVITGMGAFSAAGDTAEKLWLAAHAGQSLAVWREFADGEDKGKFAVCGAPELDITQPELHPVRKMDRCVQMAWVAANEAWRQATIVGVYPSSRIGVVVGSSRGPFSKRNESPRQTGARKYLPTVSANSTFASLSGALAQLFNLKGNSLTVSATCASSAFAIAYAAEQILLGKLDAMLVGGTEAPLNPAILSQLDSAGVVGFHDDAKQACRPFDVRRNGLTLGEGSGFLVLESAVSAAKRKAIALARLDGWATSIDGSGRAGVNEDGSALACVMDQALQLADIRPEQIDYINAHGTGTKMNDAAEAQAVKKTFGERAATLPCSSTKPITGHCLGATPALEAVLCIEALRRQMILPTANCHQLDPECPINAQPLSAHPAKIAKVMSNSLGFWGYHASLIFSKT